LEALGGERRRWKDLCSVKKKFEGGVYAINKSNGEWKVAQRTPELYSLGRGPEKSELPLERLRGRPQNVAKAGGKRLNNTERGGSGTKDPQTFTTKKKGKGGKKFRKKRKSASDAAPWEQQAEEKKGKPSRDWQGLERITRAWAERCTKPKF